MIWLVLLMCLSFLGYGITIRVKLKAKIEFIPVFMFSSIILFMFVSGLLNFLPLMVWTILVAGLILFGYYVCQIKAGDIRKFTKIVCTPGLFIILSLALYFLFQFRGVRLLHYDNFSHWAMIVKEMELTDHLPNFSSATIEFQAYPPGSALFIYFLNRLVGFSEGRMLFTQIILMLSCLFCLFAFCEPKTAKTARVKQIITTIIMLLGSIYLLNGPSSVYDLLVDTLVLLFGLAGLAIAIYYRDNIVKAALLMGPIMGATILIKNSGIFYVLINVLYLAYLLITNRDMLRSDKINTEKVRRRIIALSSVIIIPMLCLFLWQQHVKFAFPRGQESKHAMAIENFSKTYSAKSDEDIKNITQLFVKRTFEIQNNVPVRNIIIWNIGIFIIYGLLRLSKQKERTLLFSLAFIDVVFVLYLLGLYGMYLVSMPTGESMNLAGYERYLKTITPYLEGYLMIQLVLLIYRADSIKETFMRSICSVLCMALLLFSGFQGIVHIFNRPRYIDSRRHQVEQAVTSYSPNASYVIYAPNSANDSGYLKYLLSYILWTDRSRIKTITTKIDDPEAFLSVISGRDYLIIVDDDEIISAFMGVYISKDNYVGTYQVKDTFGM